MRSAAAVQIYDTEHIQKAGLSLVSRLLRCLGLPPSHSVGGQCILLIPHTDISGLQQTMSRHPPGLHAILITLRAS